MPKTRVNCPNCRQPLVAEVNQLFDVGVDPKAKQVILTGAYNVIQCPACGYRGNLATPLVYHDPEKELLLTYFPPELGLPVNEQERIIGPLINQVMNNLPVEKRKAYLLRPQTMLTMQTMVEKILEGEGITKEMIQDQQKRLQLLQRMVDAPDDILAEMARNEDELIDENFFQLINRLTEVAMLSGDQDSAARLNDLQKKLLPLTTFGRQVQAQSQEIEAAVQSLRALGNDITREKLLELFMEAPTDLRLNVLVSVARQALDYTFFQMLTEQIDAAQGERREKLLTLRERILGIVDQVDHEQERRLDQARQIVEALLKESDVAEAMRQNINVLDEYFIQALNQTMDLARKAGDLDKIGKLQKIAEVIQEATAPPEEYALIEELVNTETDEELNVKLEANKEKITPEFLELLSTLVAQAESGEQNKEFLEKFNQLYSQALKISMQMNR